MARPRKGQELNVSRTIGIRVSESMRSAIEREAKENGRTLTDEARVLIEEALARRARPRLRGAA